MARDEARELLCESIAGHLWSEDPPADVEVDQCADFLYDLPLAIAQAAANITERKMPVHKYFTEYQRKNAKLLSEIAPGSENGENANRRSILLTWDISMDYLDNKFSESAALLRHLFCWHWANIPLSLIKLLPMIRLIDDTGFEDILKKLLQLSLVRRGTTANELHIHPLVHNRIESRLDAENHDLHLEQAIKVLSDQFPILPVRLDHDLRMRFLAVRAHVSYLQPHVQFLLSISRHSQHTSVEYVALCRQFSEFLVSIGSTRLAVSIAELAVESSTKLNPPLEQEEIHTLVYYSGMLLADAQYDNAYETSKETMARIENLREDESITEEFKSDASIEVLGWYAEAARSTDRKEEALELFKRSLDIIKSRCPDDKDAIIRATMNVTEALLDIDELEGALQMNTEMLLEAQSGTKSIPKAFIMYAMLTRAGVLSYYRDEEDSPPTELLPQALTNSIPDLCQTFWEWARDNQSIYSSRFWEGCAMMVRECLFQNELDQAYMVVNSAFEEAVGTPFMPEGRLLEWISWAANDLIDVTLEYLRASSRKAAHRRKASYLTQLLASFCQHIGYEEAPFLKVLGHGAAPSMPYASVLWYLSRNNEAEHVLRDEIARLRNKDANPSEDNDEFDSMHYWLMIAIMQQGKIEEARTFRARYMAEIKAVEEREGDLEDRIRWIREDAEIYEEAEARIAAGAKVEIDSWFREHSFRLSVGLLR